jgi:U3 small nucleolar RNA-associated protein 14
MFISSLHNIKSKNFKKINKKNFEKRMKGICFTFDAFVQCSEHDRSRMEWRMKIGIEWRSIMAGRPKIVVG